MSQRSRPVAAASTAGTAVVHAGTALGRWLLTRRSLTGRPRPHPDTDVSRWRVVTVLVKPEELRQAPTPAALAELGPGVQVQIRSAPGDKGSELAARLSDPQQVDADPGQAVRQLRTALRRAKQELEIGWPVSVTRSQVTPTPLNEPLRAAESQGQGEGAL